MNFEEFQNQSRLYVIGALEPEELEEFERERKKCGKNAEDFVIQCYALHESFTLSLRHGGGIRRRRTGHGDGARRKRETMGEIQQESALTERVNKPTGFAMLGDLTQCVLSALSHAGMKFTGVRYFSHSSTILACCCISIAFAASAAAAQFGFPDWIELSPTNSPPARSYLAMTYDPVSGKMIAFGGFDGTHYLNDTWSFDGTTWTQIATQSAPPARTAAQMTYDSVTQKVVLFGGFDGANYLGDTWLWDGSTLHWTQATPQHHPPAVTGPMLFPDPNGRADVFGGFDGQFYQLTMWQWEGSDWTQLFPPTVPFARSSAAVGTNTSTGQVVMFGGLADVNPNNTWTYDGTTWTMQSPAVQPLLVFTEPLPLLIPACKEWFSLEAEAAV